MNINHRFVQFLIRAKRHGYASQGEQNETILPQGGKQLRYQEGDYLYMDTYYGYNTFLGQEIVWQKEKALWGMQYYGKAVGKRKPPHEIYSFLKQALQNVPETAPFRGPSEFQQGEFLYKNIWQGNLENFQGKEQILFQGAIIYELWYQGGKIQEKEA